MLKKALIPTPLSHEQPRSVSPRKRQLTSPRLRWLAVTRFILTVLFQRAAMAVWPPLKKGRYSTTASARLLRDFLEDMGGLWFKVGDFVAMRSDVLGDAYCDELSQMRDIALPMPIELVRQRLETELGQPMGKVFSEFDDMALAATSTGQHHLARLRRGGYRVTVKVLRPAVEETFQRDLRYMRFVVWVFTRFNIVPHVRWGHMLWEIEKAFNESLDYRAEAEAATTMRKKLRHDKIYAPEVMDRYTRRGVLVQEFVEGVTMAQYIMVAKTDPVRLSAWCEENGVNPRRVGRKLYLSHNRQVFEENMFHCEAAPQNIILLRDNRVAFINFAIVGSFDVSVLEKYRMLYAALGEGDYNKLCEIYMLLGPPLPPQYIAAVRAQVSRAFRAWEVMTPVKSLPYADRSLTRVMRALATIFAENKVPAASEFMRLNRAELALDRSLQYLIPGINYIKIIQRYLRDSQKRALRQACTRKAQAERARSMGAITSMARNISENLHFDGEWMRTRALEFQAGISKGAEVGRRLAGLFLRVVVISGVFFVVAFVRKRRHMDQGSQQETFLSRVIERIPAYHTEIWVLIIIALLYSIYVLVLLVRRFSETDARRTNLPR